MLGLLDISTSGLVAQRQRLDTIAGNIANANATRNADGEATPFLRRFVSFHPEPQSASPQSGVGVGYTVDVDRSSPTRRVHEPGHPDADADGYVTYPNIDVITEFVNAMEAGRAYEANISAMEITKQLAEMSLQIIA
ncbi:flagellar basal body rod protein FlgC [Thalassoroseus pseudoceratinae]|uniref:flagellar basal body rod protein FlgC n=1 Tax=Thalassoroseus pseudoceratinae TaxID=2713176 RepID=UPI00141DB538|nr:flagellar basal body rod protein FlgC [Thalassoroseus pseudoceratinae]